MNHLHIRLATPADAPAIHAVTLDAFSEYTHTDAPSSALRETLDHVQGPLERGEMRAAVAERDDSIVAAVRFREEDGLYFYRLAVSTGWQGRGIAKALIAWLEAFAQQEGASRIWCKVRKAVTRNVRLYEQLGFAAFHEETVWRSPDVRIDVVWMEKHL